MNNDLRLRLEHCYMNIDIAKKILQHYYKCIPKSQEYQICYYYIVYALHDLRLLEKNIIYRRM